MKRSAWWTEWYAEAEWSQSGIVAARTGENLGNGGFVKSSGMLMSGGWYIRY